MSTASLRLQPPQDDALAQVRPLGAAVRICEAMLFAAREPLSEAELAASIPTGVKLGDVLAHLQSTYGARGVHLVQTGAKWTFRTAPDLGYLFTREAQEPRKLSRAANETLSIIAYHQPVTRAEIEDIRGVATAKGTLDVLLETGWVRMRGRRRTPGRPITFGTTEAFLSHFNLAAVGDLPGLDELKAAGMIDGRIPMQLNIPMPSDDPALRPDEDPLDIDPLVLAAEERINEGDEPLELDEDEVSAEIEESLDPLDGDHRAR
jgi:segregation and condensation protein B